MPRTLVTFVFLLLVLARPSSVTAAEAADAPLRVVIAGLVHDHVFGFLDRVKRRSDLSLVGVAEPDRALSARLASRYALDLSLFSDDLEKLLAKARPQAVLIYTDTRDHRRVVEISARHRLPVMMEKPLAVNVEDARAIEKAARESGIAVLVNYETTWYRSNHAAKDLVRRGVLGEIRKVVVHDGHQGPKEIGVSDEFFAWLTDPDRNGGGALFDFGCYGADLMTWLMEGRRPDAVTAVTQRIKPDLYPRVDDEATILLTYPRAQAIIQASWNWPFGRKDMEVYGRTGYAITVERDTLRARLAEGEEKRVEAAALPPHYEDPVAYLRAVVLGGLKPEGLGSLETNLVVTEILDAARRSAATGKTIPLAP